jgi:hypothetical protein
MQQQQQTQRSGNSGSNIIAPSICRQAHLDAAARQGLPQRQAKAAQAEYIIAVLPANKVSQALPQQRVQHAKAKRSCLALSSDAPGHEGEIARWWRQRAEQREQQRRWKQAESVVWRMPATKVSSVLR